jgi:cold shock CspA family protein
MEGVLKTLNKKGFGFIEESTTKRLWYFRFCDLTRFQRIQEGYRVQFEKKGDHPQAPAAHRVEILDFVPKAKKEKADGKQIGRA